MTEELVTKFESQLPKLNKFSIGNFINYVAVLFSIGSPLVPSLFGSSKDISQIFYASILIIIISILVIRDIYLENERRYRYEQAVIFTHYVNHLIRDSLAEMANGKVSNFEKESEKTIRRIIEAIATCFSIIVAKRCRACIVELRADFSLEVVARDSISQEISKKNFNKQKRMINGNTDFKNLWFGLHGCSRYYLSNNLKRDWKNDRYMNSSFEDVGMPEVVNVIHGISFVKNWKLNYKSAVILPIRYISSFNPPSGFQADLIDWDYYGFLCVDCNSINAFDDTFSPELCGTFADAIYSYLAQIDFIEDSFTRP